MAEPINFPEANLRLLPPAGQEGDVIAMHARREGGRIVSCWRLSRADLLRIADTGEVWLSVRSGDTAPPVLVTGLKEEVL